MEVNPLLRTMDNIVIGVLWKVIHILLIMSWTFGLADSACVPLTASLNIVNTFKPHNYCLQ